MAHWPLSARHGFLPALATRIFWLKLTILLAFAIGLAMSWRLWIGPRSYPPVPVWSFLPALEAPWSHWLFSALFVLAAGAIVAPRPRPFLLGFLAVIAIFCLFDETRWQPWVFIYCGLLATLAFHSGGAKNGEDQRRSMNAARLIIACTYVFSGLQKLNLNFAQNDFPWIVQPLTRLYPPLQNLLPALGMMVPFVQVAFGLGLLAPRFRRASLAVAVAMHLFILAMLGPMGHAWNSIIWPWTAAMAILDIVLFAEGGDYSFREVLSAPRHPSQLAALVVFGVLPILSFFNHWDSYLSAALYSGNLTEAELYATDAGKASLPEAIGRHFIATSPNTNVLNMQRWAIEDLDTTPYPETRVYKAVAKSVCDQARAPGQLILVIREQRLFLSKPETGYRCGEL